jgi:hypothetical protein
VNETLDLQKSLKAELGMKLDRIFLNGLYPDLFDDSEAAALEERLERDVQERDGDGVLQRAALRAAVSEHRRATAQREQLERLERGSRRSVVELPFVFRPQLDMSAVELLADEVEEGV